MNVFKQIVKRLKEDDATTLDELALRVDMLPTQITETIFKLNLIFSIRLLDIVDLNVV